MSKYLYTERGFVKPEKEKPIRASYDKHGFKAKEFFDEDMGSFETNAATLVAIPAADPSKFIVGNWYEEDRDFKIDMDYTKGIGSERFPIAIHIEPSKEPSEESKPTYEQVSAQLLRAKQRTKELETELERRNKLLEHDLKLDHRLVMPGVSEIEQEENWQHYKKKHNL